MPPVDPLFLNLDAWRRGDDRVSPTVPLVPILLKYTAKWCGPCRTIPMSKVTADLNDMGLHCVEVDVDLHEEVVNYFQIASIPAFILLVPNAKGGRSHTGPYTTTDTKQLRDWIINALAQKSN